MTTTAILSALAEEQQGLVDQLDGARRVRRAGRDFWLGQLHGRPVVLALSRIGKVAAATTATTLIEAFGTGRLLFTGVAGALGDAVQVGDLVVAEQFVQHDMDASPLFPRYELPLYRRTRIDCDPSLGALLLDACGGAVADIAREGGDHDSPAPVVHHGLIASGDRFVSTAQASRSLRHDLRAAGMEALAVEMEGAAVAQVCMDYGVPFVAVRTISDRADDVAHVDFQRFVNEVASRYAVLVVDRFVRALPPR